MHSKRWSASGYAAVAATLQAAGATVALVGADSDRAAATAVTRYGAPVHDLIGKTSVACLGALAARSRVFVGNDSGMTHLAAATGCPTVAIFGPTEPGLYAPRGQWVRVVSPSPRHRSGGDGSVRQPYRFVGPWQEHVSAATVSEAALAGLLARHPGRC
jgi:ADP-heptose:LPS heptosyltransferase